MRTDSKIAAFKNTQGHGWSFVNKRGEVVIDNWECRRLNRYDNEITATEILETFRDCLEDTPGLYGKIGEQIRSAGLTRTHTVSANIYRT